MTIPQRITTFYAATLEVIDFVVSRTSESLADILIKALPLVAPIPNAVSIYYVSQTALGFNSVQAMSVAIALECMFFALTEVVLKSWDAWRNDRTVKAPLAVSVGAFVTFFLLVMALVYVLEVRAGHSLALMAFPVVSVVAAIALGVTRWHNRNMPTLQPVMIPVSVTEVVTEQACEDLEYVSDIELLDTVDDNEDEPVMTQLPVTQEIVSTAVSAKSSTVDRRSRLSQLLTSATATADNVRRWAQEFGTSERTIWRDISVVTQGGD